MRRLNKRAAEMTIGTLVVIVLAIIVLVVIALGFGMGWGNLWSKITIYFGGGANVDSIKQACGYACTTSAVYDYCCAVKDVKYDKSGTATKLTCNSLMASEKCSNFACDGANANACAEVKCDANQVKDSCLATETEDKTKTLDFNGVPIAATQVCCKTTITAPTCKGTATACPTLTVQAECIKQKACVWGGTLAKCTGTATACPTLTVQAECTVQQGCTWS